MTYSLGGLVYLAPGITAKLDLSSATRAPTINEQYLNGTSPSFPVMARGNHSDLRDQLEHKCDAGSDLLNLQR